MVVIRIWGGIGNQIFQYVFGEYIRYRYNQEVRYDDGSFNGVDLLRKKELDIIDADIEYDATYSFSQCRGVKNRILRTLFNLTPKKHLIIENSTKIPATFKKGHTYYFQGYWQSIKYYDWLKDNVPSFEIKPRTNSQKLETYLNMISGHKESVSLHVRRGDYFLPHNVNTYGVCTKDYYHNAIKQIQKTHNDAKFFVFTDDIEWVQSNIDLPIDSIVIPNYNIPQFLYIELMSKCKHHIISNSSFSWWGAVLNEQNEAIVISPDKWTFTTVASIALERWIKQSC